MLFSHLLTMDPLIKKSMTDFLLYILFQLIKKSVCYLTFTETSTSLRSNETSNYARRDTLIAINTPFMLNLSFLVGTNERVTFLQNSLDCVISIIVTFFPFFSHYPISLSLMGNDFSCSNRSAQHRTQVRFSAIMFQFTTHIIMRGLKCLSENISRHTPQCGWRRRQCC